MPGMSYKAGDIIFLKPRNYGSRALQQSARILSVLPEARGSIGYRVHLDGENFDRNISEDDIDPAFEVRREPDRATAKNTKTSGWIDHDRLRTKK